MKKIIRIQALSLIAMCSLNPMEANAHHPNGAAAAAAVAHHNHDHCYSDGFRDGRVTSEFTTCGGLTAAISTTAHAHKEEVHIARVRDEASRFLLDGTRTATLEAAIVEYKNHLSSGLQSDSNLTDEEICFKIIEDSQ